jgi:outer membrane receptor for ferrienterochelin and colicins
MKRIRFQLKAMAIVLFCGSLLLLSAPPGRAQSGGGSPSSGETKETILFEEIPSVYGASKYEQKVTEAPSSVSIVTAAEIKKYGYRTLADILRSIRGFYVTYDRIYPSVGVRGFNRPADYGNRFVLLVDGHRQNEALYGSITSGMDFIVDVDLIDRVEVIRGPSSSIYGSNAFLGVINVITRKGRDIRGGEVSGDGGSFSTYKGRLTYGDRFRNGLEMTVSGTGFQSDGHRRLYFPEFDAPSTNYGVAENADRDQSRSLFTTVSFHEFTFQGAWVDRKKTIPTGSDGADFNNPFNRVDDERAYLDLKYEHTFGDRLSLTARLFYDRYNYSGNYIYGGVVNRDLGVTQGWGSEIRATRTFFGKHRLTLGGEYVDNIRQDQANYNELPYTSYVDDRRSTRTFAFYLQDEFAVFKNLLLNAGIRYDRFELSGGTFNPRLALIYSPFEKTILKFLYGRAFRVPNFYELYFQDNLYYKSNPNLKPEIVHTGELVWEQYIGTRLRGTASLFYSRINDLIDQVADPGDGSLRFQNRDSIETKGLELEIEGKWPGGLEGRISYSLQETRDRETGEVLANSPRHLAKANLILPAPFLKDRLYLGLEEQYTSGRRSLAGKEAKGFLITNATLFSQKLVKGLELSGGVYNLFDKRYADPSPSGLLQDTLRQDGRNFRLKLTYSF